MVTRLELLQIALLAFVISGVMVLPLAFLSYAAGCGVRARRSENYRSKIDRAIDAVPSLFYKSVSLHQRPQISIRPPSPTRVLIPWPRLPQGRGQFFLIVTCYLHLGGHGEQRAHLGSSCRLAYLPS
jgi:hypothetical protein